MKFDLIDKIIDLINKEELPSNGDWDREQFAMTICCTIMEIVAKNYLDAAFDSYDEKMKIFSHVLKTLKERISMHVTPKRNTDDCLSVN